MESHPTWKTLLSVVGMKFNHRLQTETQSLQHELTWPTKPINCLTLYKRLPIPVLKNHSIWLFIYLSVSHIVTLICFLLLEIQQSTARKLRSGVQWFPKGAQHSIQCSHSQGQAHSCRFTYLCLSFYPVQRVPQWCNSFSEFIKHFWELYRKFI
jgi:hypothetical protein